MVLLGLLPLGTPGNLRSEFIRAASPEHAWCEGARLTRKFGRVEIAGFYGTLVDAAGPISGAAIRWRRARTRVWDEGNFGTDEKGRFWMTDLPPGDWEIEFCIPEHEGLRGTLRVVESSPVSQITLYTNRTNFK
jgi:hypothetical protein